MHAQIPGQPGNCAGLWHRDRVGAAVTDWVLDNAGQGQSTVLRTGGDTENRHSMGQYIPGTHGCPAVGHGASSAFCYTCQEDNAVSHITNPGAQGHMELGRLLCVCKR